MGVTTSNGEVVWMFIILRVSQGGKLPLISTDQL